MPFTGATVVLLASLAIATAKIDPATLTGKALVDYVNSLNTSWTATTNNFAPSVNPHIYRTGGAWDVDDPDSASQIMDWPFEVLDTVPTSFDAREAWPDCSDVISTIRDQAKCGCCWAIAVSGAISDRICINMGKSVLISTVDIFSCCRYCGRGCSGGYANKAWDYYIKYGIVTGGLYDSHEGCKPYPFKPCNHDGPVTDVSSDNDTMSYCGKPNQFEKTPTCTSTCETGYNIPLTVDKHFGYFYYRFTINPLSRRVLAIMSEIYISGSVTACFTFYEDLFNYKSGVYHHVSGRRIYGHCVRIIGWGTEGGVDYWLIANSFNTFWGDGGYFKMRRGTNECGIENNVYAGLPRLPG